MARQCFGTPMRAMNWLNSYQLRFSDEEILDSAVYFVIDQKICFDHENHVHLK